MLSLTRRQVSASETFIDGALHASPGSHVEFLRSGMPRLVFNPSRPTMVGWRWDQSPHDDPARPEGKHGDPELISMEFTYRPDRGSQARALFPEGRSSYQVEAELDIGKRTIWFPLPMGNCVLSLHEELWLPYHWPLAQFIDDWLFDRAWSTCGISVDYGQTVSEEDGVEVVVNVHEAPGDEYKSMHIMIPKELLQDRIANGSRDHSDGFNPWNEEQKAQIIAHLDPLLPRLIGFFETTAESDREDRGFASGNGRTGSCPSSRTPRTSDTQGRRGLAA